MTRLLNLATGAMALLVFLALMLVPAGLLVLGVLLWTRRTGRRWP